MVNLSNFGYSISATIATDKEKVLNPEELIYGAMETYMTFMSFMKNMEITGIEIETARNNYGKQEFDFVAHFKVKKDKK